MELLLRIHHGESATADVRVEIDPTQPAALLASAVGEYLGTGGGRLPALLLARTGEYLEADAAVGETGVLSGDEIVVDPRERFAPPLPLPIRGVSIDVLAGPDSGHSAVLDRGIYLIGRDPACDIAVSDQSVSRTHLRTEVAADWTVTVTPQPDTENGVYVNDRLVTGPTGISGDDVVTMGATRVAFREFTRSNDEVRDQLGQIEFHRTPYRPERVQPVEFDRLGPVPSPQEPRRFQALSAIAPLAAGLALYAFSGQAQFLALTLISPLAIVANWIEDRRSGRSGYTRQVARFRDRVEKRRREVDEALETERVARLRAAPDLADLARRAELRTINLWPRSREAEDFLSVRVGLGEVPTRVKAPVENGGDDELRDEALEALAHHVSLSGVPVACDLVETGVLAVHGDSSAVDDVAAAIAVQVACLHTPEDLVVASALAPDRPIAQWLKWLPHVRSVTSPVAGRHLTTTQDGARRLLGELVEVATLREPANDRNQDRRWPWVVVFLDADLEPDPTLVSQLLDRCGETGISVVWLSTSEARVPHQAKAVVDCQLNADGDATLWYTDPEKATQTVELARVHPDIADRVARALAPVRDATVATATSAIPRTAPLLDVLGVENPDRQWITERWLTERPYGLSHAVGLGADGPFTLDLVADGPHALIGGTSGAGKSELLQSMVASLVATYPPTRLNFLFVDYKGGASSTGFRDVPHTVGYVTNLDGELSLRALTSLRAELNRRMRLLEGKAKDLEEMLERHPEEAPPSLVIVVDEFATLVKEIPDFVAGMVDIAQRGRSLGIHLVLATQRPSGSVNDNILANTNLRIALRMLDAADSSSIIGTAVASEIPVPLRGRAFARLGPRELVPFQSAYAGAPVVASGGEPTVLIGPYAIDGEGPVLVRGTASVAPDGRSHLDVLLDAVRDAADALGFPPSRPPWSEMLAEHIDLQDVRAQLPVGMSRAPGRMIAVGTIDDPEEQTQYPALVDLEEGGGLLVYGSGGSGKTTLLRTAASSAASDGRPDEVVIFALDFASRALRSITPLPHVAAVAAGDDLEAVTRVIALLDAELERRRHLLAEAQAENLSAYLARGGHLPRVLLLVDGYPSLAAAFSGGGYTNPLDQWLDAFHRVVLDGRQVGIHAVLTADRRAGIPALLQAGFANRIVLRQSDENGYTDHGIAPTRARGLDVPPGRGLWQAKQLMQVACVADAGDAAAQAEALRVMGADAAVGDAAPAIITAPLPEIVEEASPDVTTADPVIALGVADLTLQPVQVDLAHSHFLITGLPRSGRSSATLLAGRQLASRGIEVWAVGGGNSPLARETAWARAGFGRTDAVLPVLDELATTVEAFAGSPQRVLVIDDLESLEDPTFGSLWERLTKSDHLRVVASIETRSYSGFSMNAMLNELRKARRVLFLQPDDPVELFQLSGVRPPIRPGTSMPPGRGVLLVDRNPTVVQVARPR